MTHSWGQEEEEGAVVNLNRFNGACPSKEKATVGDDEDVTAASPAAAPAATGAAGRRPPVVLLFFSCQLPPSPFNQLNV